MHRKAILDVVENEVNRCLFVLFVRLTERMKEKKRGNPERDRNIAKSLCRMVQSALQYSRIDN